MGTPYPVTGPSDDPSLREIASRWLESMRHHVRETTLGQYRRVAARLCSDLGELRLSEVTPLVALRYGQDRLAGGAGPATANRDWRILRQITGWAGEIGLAPDPLRHVRRPPARQGAPRNPARPLTAEEWRRFSAALHRDDERRLVPQFPLFLALAETGCRLGEVLALEWSAVNLAGEALVVRAETAKTHRERVVPLSPPLLRELEILAGLHQTLRDAGFALADRVFLSPSGRRSTPSHVRAFFDRTLQAARVSKRDNRGRRVSPHSLRHTLASRLAASGVPAELTAQMLGHRTPRITEQVYTHRRVEDLRTALAAQAWGSDPGAWGVVGDTGLEPHAVCDTGQVSPTAAPHPGGGAVGAPIPRMEVVHRGLTGRLGLALDDLGPDEFRRLLAALAAGARVTLVGPDSLDGGSE